MASIALFNESVRMEVTADDVAYLKEKHLCVFWLQVDVELDKLV